MNLVYYNCLICKIHFFASCNFAYGTMGQDDREGRTLNLFLLDEISCVDIENEETLFDDLAVPLDVS